jgi:peptidoglycan/LPS O-acetylase OafA/YrhL
MDRPKRDVWLDCLRAVAVLLVLGRHMEFPDTAPAWLWTWYCGGWAGVDLFFVLSGFLVSGLLFREYQQRQTLSLPRFLIRRGLRIYPAFYTLLLGTWLLSFVLPFPRSGVAAYLAEIFFIQNYHHGVWPHTWSLAVEEHFYLGMPLVLLWLMHTVRGQADPFRRLVVIIPAVLVGVLALRCVNAWYRPFSPRTHMFATHLRADALWAGVLLAYVHHFRRAALDRIVRGRHLLLALLGVACFVPAFTWPLRTWFIYTIALSLNTMGGVLLLSAGIGCTLPRPARLLAMMGSESYSIYLWHFPVLFWVLPWCERMFELPLYGRLALYLTASLLVGAAMSRLTEWPVLRLRDRWFPSRSDGRVESRRSMELRRVA